jgi:hypothetical protein
MQSLIALNSLSKRNPKGLFLPESENNDLKGVSEISNGNPMIL